MRAARCRNCPKNAFEFHVKNFLRLSVVATLLISLFSFSVATQTQASNTSKLQNFGSIYIPSIGVTAPLHVGIDDASLAKGFGLWPNTALPGSRGNTVVGGHRTSHLRPLFYIDKIAIGDIIYFYTPTGTAKYKVTKHQIVKPRDVWIIRQTRASIATFFACHPLRSIKERYVVTASLVKFTPKKKR
jgi:LPXTG-site transpeptidase (sortase) family protein